MPTLQDIDQRHAERFLTLLEEINQLEQLDDAEQGKQLNNLEDLWLQINNAWTWALKQSGGDKNANCLGEAFENAGVEIAQVRAETRMALRQLKNSLLDPQ